MGPRPASRKLANGLEQSFSKRTKAMFSRPKSKMSCGISRSGPIRATQQIDGPKLLMPSTPFIKLDVKIFRNSQKPSNSSFAQKIEQKPLCTTLAYILYIQLFTKIRFRSRRRTKLYYFGVPPFGDFVSFFFELTKAWV